MKKRHILQYCSTRYSLCCKLRVALQSRVPRDRAYKTHGIDNNKTHDNVDNNKTHDIDNKTHDVDSSTWSK